MRVTGKLPFNSISGGLLEDFLKVGIFLRDVYSHTDLAIYFIPAKRKRNPKCYRVSEEI